MVSAVLYNTRIGRITIQRILSIAIVLAMLGSTTLWAMRGIEKGRNYNRNVQWKSDTEKNPNWGNCIGMDSDGDISSYASITVDVDRILENWDGAWWKIQRRGVDYSAYANIWADNSVGSWSVSASVPGDMDGLSGFVLGDTYREANASGFDWMFGDPGDVENYLGNAQSSGAVSIPGHRSEAMGENFDTIGDS